jgi:hypothetical protein
MKYIVVSAIKTSKVPGGDTSVIRYPFVFPNNFVHLHVSKVVSLLVSLMHPTHEIRTTSAGDINSMDFNGDCSGKSDSLNVKSADGDTNLVKMNDYGAGMLEM